MKIFNTFDFATCRAHLDKNECGALLITMDDDREFSVTILDDAIPGSTLVTGTSFPDRPVTFDTRKVTFVMLMPFDPRQNWHQDRTEYSISTRQRRRKSSQGVADGLAAA